MRLRWLAVLLLPGLAACEALVVPPAVTTPVAVVADAAPPAPAAECAQHMVHLPMVISFPAASAELDAQGREIAGEVVGAMGARADVVRVRVEAHLDWCGDPEVVDLSEARARVVADELLRLGVAPERVETIAYLRSGRSPCDCPMPDPERPANTDRRVEFTFVVCRPV